MCDIGTVQCDNETIKCKKKNKETNECDKSTVTCDIGTAQFENGIIKCEKKNMSTTKCDKSMVKYSNVMLVLPNVTTEPSNVRGEKKRESPNVTKVQLHVMLVMPNVTIKLSNVRKKFKYHWM